MFSVAAPGAAASEAARALCGRCARRPLPSPPSTELGKPLEEAERDERCERELCSREGQRRRKDSDVRFDKLAPPTIALLDAP